VNYTEQAARDRVSKLQSKLDAEERKDDREEYEDRHEDIVRSLKVEEFLADNGARTVADRTADVGKTVMPLETFRP
jgi:hypothetical protein